MGKVKGVLIDIEEMLELGYTHAQISNFLKCPPDWIAHVEKELNGEEQGISNES